MKKADKKKIARLRKFSPVYFKALKQGRRENFYKAEIEFTCYIELMSIISDLLKLCINAECYEATGSSPYITSKPNIQGILELVLQLLPIDEAELLDDIRPLLDGKKEHVQNFITNKETS